MSSAFRCKDDQRLPYNESEIVRLRLEEDFAIIASEDRVELGGTITFTDFLNWTTENHLGDLSGLLGILISLIGFIVTIVNVRRSKSAASLAAQAATDIKNAIGLYDAIADIAGAVVALEEIQRHIRAENWNVLPDRYTSLRKILITVRARNPHVTDEDKSKIQAAITTVIGLQEALERARDKNKSPDYARKIHLLSDNIDALHSILVGLQAKVGGDKNGK